MKKQYNLDLIIEGHGIILKINGKVGLEKRTTDALKILNQRYGKKEPAVVKGKKKPLLTKEDAYYWLEKGKDNEWFEKRYRFKKYQLAGYKAFMRRSE
jgi:hypothetical protein